MCSVFLILYVSDINTIKKINHLIVMDFFREVAHTKLQIECCIASLKQQVADNIVSCIRFSFYIQPYGDVP